MFKILKKCSNRLIFRTLWLVICKLMWIQILIHLNTSKWIKIRIQLITLTRIRILPFSLMRIRIYNTAYWCVLSNHLVFPTSNFITEDQAPSLERRHNKSIPPKENSKREYYLFQCQYVFFFYKFVVYERALTPKILSHCDELLLQQCS
jgi:hypothetical protein